MFRVTIHVVFIVVILSKKCSTYEVEKTVDQNATKFLSFASSALKVFERFNVSRILLRACSTTETYLWWNKINENKNASLITSFEEDNMNDGILLDVRCKTGMKTLETIINENIDRVSFPQMIIAASNNSNLNLLLKRLNLEGKFLADGLAVAKPPIPEFPSVLRVAIPEKKMATDPAGAIIASKLIEHVRDVLKLTLSFRQGNLSDVSSGNADLVGDAVSIDEKFTERVVFLGRQIWRQRTSVLIKTPGFLWDTDALLRPFSMEVWLSVGLSIVATSLVLRSVAFWESRGVNAHPQTGEENTWSFSVMTAMGVMCAQGFTCSTKWTAGRLTLVTYEVFSLFVGLFYSSAMVTFLLKLPETDIKTAPDLMKWPLSIGVDPSYYSIPDLVESKDPTVRTIIDSKAEALSLWDALALAPEQPVAFLTGEYTGITAAGVALDVSTVCRLQAVSLRPDWPLFLAGSKTVFTPWLLEIFRRALAHVAEVGMLSAETRRAAARPLTCLQSDVTDTEAIGFRAIWPGVAMLGIGHLISVIIFFVEICVDAWRRHRPLHRKSA